MKKALLIVPLVLLGLLFWSPWMGEEGGEDVIRETIQIPEVRAELDTLMASYSCQDGLTSECCDGPSSSWAPFGRNVEYCGYGQWYVPFWGN